MTLAVVVAGVASLVLSQAVAQTAEPWVDGPPAPAPSTTQPLPYPEAPREPGARSEVLTVPPVPPEPARPLLDDGIPLPLSATDPRLVTERTRDALWRSGAAPLDLDGALVDVPGLWLRHEQAGASRLLMRGLADGDVAVVVDGVPLFDLGGLLPPLEQLSIASTARLRIHHGPRVGGAARGVRAGRAGVVDVDTLGTLRDQGESTALHGVLGGGYGGADLEKGVFTQLETGTGRARLGVHATLLNREDQRLGRGFPSTSPAAPGFDVPGGLRFGSGGSGGAAGARVDVVPFRALHVFSTWHSARALDVADTARCSGPDDRGRAVDCTRTVERGVDAWIVGADQRHDVAGAVVVARARAHMQHGIAIDERSGSGILVVERAFDEGVRAGARADVSVTLAPIALGDVWTPTALIGADWYGDLFDSRFTSRSVRGRDAEPPGGIADPTRARLADGSSASFSALSLELRADGARTTLWGAGRAFVDTFRPAADAAGAAFPAFGVGNGGAAEGEVGARVRVIESVSAFGAVVHRADDDTGELGLGWRVPWATVELVGWGSARRDLELRDLSTEEEPAQPLQLVRVDRTAWGAEARGSVVTGLDGLSASGTFALVSVDDGAPLSASRAPASAVPNPSSTLTVRYAPSTSPAGFFARARALLPQQRLSPAEELDRALCPELPGDEELAAGAVRTAPCTGAVGSFLLDVGAHVEIGTWRIDAIAENLLDQQGALRDEPIGFGGAAVRALLTLAL